MNKYEQYADAIRELKNNKFYTDFIEPNLVLVDNEYDMDCNATTVYHTLLLLDKYEEYFEPEKLHY